MLRSLFIMLVLASGVTTILWFGEACQDPIRPNRVHAQDPIDRELALALAKVCVNEAGWNSPADCAMIWQVVESRARTAADRLGWLQRHSACIVDPSISQEAAEARLGNCAWSRNLSWGDAQPTGWPERTDWEPYKRRWRRVRNLSRALVLGVEHRRPCVETPDTWGGPMDHAHAVARGFIPVQCEGTLNTGYRFP